MKTPSTAETFTLLLFRYPLSTGYDSNISNITRTFQKLPATIFRMLLKYLVQCVMIIELKI